MNSREYSATLGQSVLDVKMTVWNWWYIFKMPFIILKFIVQKSRKYVRTSMFREELDSAIIYYITINPGVYPLISQWGKTAGEYLRPWITWLTWWLCRYECPRFLWCTGPGVLDKVMKVQWFKTSGSTWSEWHLGGVVEFFGHFTTSV